MITKNKTSSSPRKKGRNIYNLEQHNNIQKLAANLLKESVVNKRKQ